VAQANNSLYNYVSETAKILATTFEIEALLTKLRPRLCEELLNIQIIPQQKYFNESSRAANLTSCAFSLAIIIKHTLTRDAEF
jgi:hypothetical protein